MSESIRNTIDELEKKLEGELATALETKKAINTLLGMIHEKPRYEEVVEKAKNTIRKDEYFNKPLATAVRMFLEKKGEAASVIEIIAELSAGGYDIGNPKFADRNIRISLGKNSTLFAYIKANDSFGLKSKYGLRNIKKTDKKEDEIEAEEKE